MPDPHTETCTGGPPAGALCPGCGEEIQVPAVTVVHRDPAWAEVRSKITLLAGHDIGSVLTGRRPWWVDRLGRAHPAA